MNQGKPEFESWINRDELFAGNSRGSGMIMVGPLNKAFHRSPEVDAEGDVLAVSNVPLIDRHGDELRFSVQTNQPEAERIMACELNDAACYTQLLTPDVTTMASLGSGAGTAQLVPVKNIIAAGAAATRWRVTD